jgi:hypothetical protein
MIAEIGVNGWRDAVYDPPETDRIVQVAWDDMSTSPNAKGFYDSAAETPPSSRRFWWTFDYAQNFIPLSDDCVLAWREVQP